MITVKPAIYQSPETSHFIGFQKFFQKPLTLELMIIHGLTTILGTWTIYYGTWAKEMKSMESERRFEEVKLDKIVPEKYASRANYNF